MRIKTTGVITMMGNDEESIWNNLLMKEKKEDKPKELPYNSLLTKRVLRRLNRFSDMAATGAINCFRKLEQLKLTSQKDRVGCIFTTAFGPLKTNLEFAKQIIEDEPDSCSPILFSNTVHNACLGGISINLGITGPSTMLLGSNHLLLAQLVLEEDKADVVLAGCIDEYSSELEDSLRTRGCKSKEIGESAVVLGLVKDGITRDGVKISYMHSTFLGCNPMEDETPDQNVLKEEIIELCRQKVDAVIINDPLMLMGQKEKEIFMQDIKRPDVIDQFYEYFGNCLGADLGLKVLLAKIILEHEAIPEGLCSEGTRCEKVEKIGVLSTDITGSYTIAIIER